MRAINVTATFGVSASGAFAVAVVLLAMSGEALAQTTGTVDQSAGPADLSPMEDVPVGSCMPIGMTASGEMVFPIQCKAIIERGRGKTVEQNASTPEQKPAAKQSEAVAPESSSPAIKPVETIPAPKHAEPEPRERVVRRGGCQNFQSYDPKSETYTGYDGQRHSCR
jgi:hypothetical protein